MNDRELADLQSIRDSGNTMELYHKVLHIEQQRLDAEQRERSLRRNLRDLAEHFQRCADGARNRGEWDYAKGLGVAAACTDRLQSRRPAQEDT